MTTSLTAWAPDSAKLWNHACVLSTWVNPELDSQRTLFSDLSNESVEWPEWVMAGCHQLAECGIISRLQCSRSIKTSLVFTDDMPCSTIHYFIHSWFCSYSTHKHTRVHKWILRTANWSGTIAIGRVSYLIYVSMRYYVLTTSGDIIVCFHTAVCLSC